MTNWKMIAHNLRVMTVRHAEKCHDCTVRSVNGEPVALVSDRCREGAMILSEVAIADVHAEVQSIKRMHVYAP